MYSDKVLDFVVNEFGFNRSDVELINESDFELKNEVNLFDKILFCVKGYCYVSLKTNKKKSNGDILYFLFTADCLI